MRECAERSVRNGRVPLGEYAHAARRLESALGGRARDRRAAAHARLPGSLFRSDSVIVHHRRCSHAE